MKVNLRQICGPWDEGFVLDKHMLKSTYIGDGPTGRPQFDNVRTEAGEATFQLKYRSQANQAPLLAKAIAESICPKFEGIGFIVPMPASNVRQTQPVNMVAGALASILGVPFFDNLLVKKPSGKSLKDLNSREEKLAALAGTITVNEIITNEGKWNVLLVDDLYDSGASMETASMALRTYRKVGRIYVAALTWK